MNEPFSDELISAFLDGELTADEQSLVEQTLMDSVEHRQVFEELRALRGSLQSLPSHKLPGDFSQRVLRRAERAMLSEEQPAVPVGDQASTSGKLEAGNKSEGASLAVAPAASIKPYSAAPGQMRIAVLACAALAAALMVAIYLPKIELTPVVVRELGDVSKRGLSDKLDKGHKNRPTPKKPVEERQGTVDVAPLRPGEGGEVAPERQDLNRAIAATLDAKEKDERANEFGERGLGRGEGTKGGELPGARRAVVDSLQAEKSQAPYAKEYSDTLADPKPAAGLLANGLAKGKELANGLARDKQLTETVETELVVIPVNCTRQALESGAFDLVLKRHNIFFDDALTANAPADATAKDSAEYRRYRQLSEQASAAGFDMVEVEATRAQIDGILADFQAHSDQFLGVTVQPLALEDSERPALLARANRAKKSLAGAEDKLKLLSDGKGTAGNLAATKEIGPPAGPPTALDKVAGGVRGGASPAGAGGGGPPAPAAPRAIGGAPAPAAGQPGLSKDRVTSADFGKTDDAKRLDDIEQAKSAKKTDGSRKETERVAGDRSDSAEFEARYAGRASRLATPEFNKFYRLRGVVERQDQYAAPAEEKKAESEGLDRSGVAGEGREAAAKHAEESLSEIKRRPAALKQDVDKNVGLKSEHRESLGKPSNGSLEKFKKYATTSGQERVRVLFVIRAIPEDVPAAKPE